MDRGRPTVADALEAAARAELLDEGVPAERIRVTRRAQLRYDGTDTALAGRAGRARRHDRRRSRPPPCDVLLPPGPAADRRSGLGGGDRAHRAARSRPHLRRRSSTDQRRLGPDDRPALLGRSVARRPAASSGSGCGPGTTIDRPGDHRRGQRHHRRRRRLAGDDDPGRAPARRAGACPRASPSGHRGRSGAAGDLQQPVHVDRRADGRPAGVHRPVGEHQGAAGLLLRAVRPRRQPDRQRPAHPGAPRLDGHQRQGGHPPPRPAPCGPGDVYAVNDPYHGGTHLPDVTVVTPVFDAGDGERPDPVLRRLPRPPRRDRRASPPAPCPRTAATIHEEGVLFDNWLLVEDGRFREAETPAPAHRGARTRRAIPTTNLADLRAQIAANQQGRRRGRQDDRPLRPRRRPGLHAPRPGQRRGGGPPRHRRARRRRVPLRDGLRRA